jgi:hypothetical protein
LGHSNARYEYQSDCAFEPTINHDVFPSFLRVDATPPRSTRTVLGV